jgi:hypothetical protein
MRVSARAPVADRSKNVKMPGMDLMLDSLPDHAEAIDHKEVNH